MTKKKPKKVAVSAPKIEPLEIAKIRLDGGTQSRAVIDSATVEEYAESITSGVEFPPIVAYYDDAEYWLADGFHRVLGARQAGYLTITAEVRRGSLRDAILHAVGANRTHGLKRTNADKRRAVMLLLADPEWCGYSDRHLADLAGVGHPFVASLRPGRTKSEKVDASSNGIGFHSDNLSESQDDDSEMSGTRTSKDGRTVQGRRVRAEDVMFDESGDDCPFDPDPPKEPERLPGRPVPADPKTFRSPAPVEREPGDDTEIEAKVESEILPPTPVDAWDIPIQPHAEAAFAAVSKFQELLSLIRKAQKAFHELASSAGGKFLTLPDVASYRRGAKGEDGVAADRFVHSGLERALKQVAAAVPTHTVCPWQFVDAPHPEDCKTCLGGNWTPVLGKNIPEMAKERAREKYGV